LITTSPVVRCKVSVSAMGRIPFKFSCEFP
jgi:hypothetical protein